MPSTVALIVCTIFVLYSLRLECKQSPETTPIVWIPVIWIISVASRPLGMWFGAGGGEVAASDGSFWDRIFQSTIMLIGLIILLFRRSGRQGIIRDNIPLFMLICYMLMSVFWSDVYYTSFKRCMREMPVIIMALVISTEKHPLNAIESVFRRTAYILIPFSFLLIKYYTFLGVSYARWSGELMWIGVTLHKNSLGGLCLFVAFFLIWSLLKRWQNQDKIITKYNNFIEILILGLTLYLMGGPNHSLTYSATSNLSFVIGMLSLFGLYFLKKRNINIGQTILIGAATIIFIYGTITPFLGKLSIIDPSATMGRQENLTDRASIWEVLLPYAMQKPIIGYGYGGFWKPEIHAITSSHAHNGYLDVILDLGFIGLVFFYMFLFSCCKKAHSMLIRNSYWGILFVCFILMNVTYNIAETALYVFSNEITATLIFLYILANPNLSELNVKANATVS